MNCKVQKYRVLVMGLLILSLMGLSGCGRQESTANVPKLKDPVGVDVDTAKVKKNEFKQCEFLFRRGSAGYGRCLFCKFGTGRCRESRNWRQGKEGAASGYAYRLGIDGERFAEGVTIPDCRNAETNASSQSKIEQLNIELKAVQKQKKQAKNTKEKNNLGKQIVQKQEEIKTERLRLKLQKQTQKQYISELKSDIANAKKSSKLNRLYSPVNGEVIAKKSGTRGFCDRWCFGDYNCRHG